MTKRAVTFGIIKQHGSNSLFQIILPPLLPDYSVTGVFLEALELLLTQLLIITFSKAFFFLFSRHSLWSYLKIPNLPHLFPRQASPRLSVLPSQSEHIRHVGNAKLRAVTRARSDGLLGPWLLTQNSIAPRLHFGCKCHIAWSATCSRGEKHDKNVCARHPWAGAGVTGCNNDAQLGPGHFQP